MASPPAAASNNNIPKAPSEKTDVELRAIQKLKDAKLLSYHNSGPYPLRPNPLRKGAEDSKKVSTLLEEFRDDLLLNVGADVVAGTIFALNIDSEEDEKKYFSQEKTYKVDRKWVSSGDDRQQEQQASPYPDPGSASAPDDLATSSFEITAFDDEGKGNTFTVPIKASESDNIIYGGEFSEVGVEGKGDVVDKTLRDSWEYPAKKVKLPPWLHHPRRFFPRLEGMIRRKLCPSAKNIAIVPYKLVMYPEDGYFQQHRDANNNAAHFGTLAINLPMEEDFEDPRPFQNPEVFEWVDGKEPRKPVKATDSSHDNDNEDDENNNSGEPKRTEGGALRFYLGRDFAPGSRNTGWEKKSGSTLQNLLGDSDHGRAADSLSMLTGCVLMQNYQQEELEGKFPFVSASGNRLVESLHAPDGRDITEEEAIKNANGDESKMPPQLYEMKNGTRKMTLEKYVNDFATKTHPPKKNFSKLHRKHTPLKWSAWLSDVFHEILPLKGSSKRFVMTYKLLKDDIVAPVQIPRQIMLTHKLEQLVSAFKSLLVQSSSSNSQPRTFGFLLRHCYPVECLASPELTLKNVDAVLYHILSQRFECVLTPAYLNKDNDVGVPYLDDPQSKKNVFLTSGFPDEVVNQLDSTSNDEIMFKHAPVIYPVDWQELGFGSIFAKSGCLGNADCGARFVYRETALICLMDQASTWSRRRVAFLIQEKGFKGNIMQQIGEYYPIFRNVVKFL